MCSVSSVESPRDQITCKRIVKMYIRLMREPLPPTKFLMFQNMKTGKNMQRVILIFSRFQQLILQSTRDNQCNQMKINQSLDRSVPNLSQEMNLSYKNMFGSPYLKVYKSIYIISKISMINVNIHRVEFKQTSLSGRVNSRMLQYSYQANEAGCNRQEMIEILKKILPKRMT